MVTSVGLESQEKADYLRHGWYRSSRRFGLDDIRKLCASVERLIEQSPEGTAYDQGPETGGRLVRALHGCHRIDEVCARLVRLPYLVSLAEELVGGPVYVYQFKVNVKQPWEGGAWPWHQDFAFWLNEDGMPRPDAVNIAIFLDDAHDGNGPLTVIPGTHRLGLLDLPDEDDSRGRGDWRRHVSADLAYTVSAVRAEALVKEHGVQRATGPRGTVYAFHPSIVHSSSRNLSPDRRALLIITYNATANAPENPTRPEFLVARDSSPVVPFTTNRL